MSKTPNARTQFRNVWVATVEDLMGMTESELDAELKEMGIDPEVAAQRGKAAVEQATTKSRAIQRERKRQQMEAARGSSGIARDPGVTADVARTQLARLIAANDGRLTLAARNRNPGDMDDEEVLALYWQIQELSR
jgi:hypothetical protein